MALIGRRFILGLAISSVTTYSFLQERGKTGVRMYQEDGLQGVVKHLNTTFFSGQEWVFQQDSVPATKAKTTQEWLRRNLPAIISAVGLPAGLSSCPKGNSGGAEEEHSGHHQHRELAFGECRPHNPGL
jgi:hypothetical protein